jgi:hypothetical protein
MVSARTSTQTNRGNGEAMEAGLRGYAQYLDQLTTFRFLTLHMYPRATPSTVPWAGQVR